MHRHRTPSLETRIRAREIRATFAAYDALAETRRIAELARDAANHKLAQHEVWRICAEEQAGLAVHPLESHWDRIREAEHGRPYTAEQLAAHESGPDFERYWPELHGPDAEAITVVFGRALREMQGEK